MGTKPDHHHRQSGVIPFRHQHGSVEVFLIEVEWVVEAWPEDFRTGGG